MTEPADAVEGMAELRSARREDLPAVLELLAAAALPSSGVAEWLGRFVVAQSGPAIVGVAGLEDHASGALLRSVVVAPEWKGRGLGRALVNEALRRAADAGHREVYLLTTAAAPYFERQGFRVMARADVPADVQESVEFREQSCASATVMVSLLEPREAIARE